MGRTSLALAPSNQNTIYALAASTVGGPGGAYTHALHAVFRSTTNGDAGTWTARVRNTDATIGNTLLLTNAPYLAVRRRATTTRAGTTTSSRSIRWTRTSSGWAASISSARTTAARTGAWRPTGGRLDRARCIAHADQHAIVFHPDYDGIGQQEDVRRQRRRDLQDRRRARRGRPRAPPPVCNRRPRRSASTGTELNNGYGVTQFYYGTAYPDGTTYFGGTQDNGTVRGTDAGGANAWARSSAATAATSRSTPATPNILYAENTGLSIQKSINGGVSFDRAPPPASRRPAASSSSRPSSWTRATRSGCGPAAGTSGGPTNRAASWTRGQRDHHRRPARSAPCRVRRPTATTSLAGMSDG